MGSDDRPTSTYPTQSQYDRWERRADALNMNMSEFVEGMVEAGIKKFDGTTTPDEDVAELRRQRNDLRSELRDARDRISRLEDQLHHGERGVIRDYVEANPGATYDDIIRHVEDTAPSRITETLDSLEGDVLYHEDGGYHPIDGGGE